MPEITREAIGRWIEEQRGERNTDALRWLIQQATLALLACYPAGTGREVLWGLLRIVAGPEPEGGQP